MTKNELKELLKLLDIKSKRTRNSYEKELIREYGKALEYTRNEYQKLFDRLGDNPNFADASRRLRNVEKNIVDRIHALTDKSISTISNSIEDTYLKNYNILTGITNKAFGIKVTFGLINETSVLANIINPYDWTNRQKRYSDVLIKNIKNEVSSGLTTGKSYPKMIKNITDNFSVSTNDASRIIRTELHRAESVSRLDSLNKSKIIGDRLGYNVLKVWSSVAGARPAHAEANGQTEDKNGFFNVGGESLQYPGDGSPENSINCRCSLVVDISNK